MGSRARRAEGPESLKNQKDFTGKTKKSIDLREQGKNGWRLKIIEKTQDFIGKKR